MVNGSYQQVGPEVRVAADTGQRFWVPKILGDFERFWVPKLTVPARINLVVPRWPSPLDAARRAALFCACVASICVYPLSGRGVARVGGGDFKLVHDSTNPPVYCRRFVLKFV